MRVVLTIAGSDSVAGAGVQADLKTLSALGVYGVSAVTAVTSQNTAAVTGVFPVPPDVVRSQIASLLQDMAVAATKTGMLATLDVVKTVVDTLSPIEHRILVVDPVMASGDRGARSLLAPEAISLMKSHLLPLATVVTPNLSEAEALTGVTVSSLHDAREAARRMLDLGPRAIVVKGGHFTGPDAIDLLYDGRTFTEFSAPRVQASRVHGTGCTFASAIAAGLALGDDVPTAVDRAKRYVTGAIEHARALGHGAALLDHFWQHGYTR